jgi:hypothetical protein
MTENTSPTGFKAILMKVSSDLVLGALVAFLSVLTGLAAYQSSINDSKEADYNVEGQKQLTDSNSMYLEQNQFVIYDYTMYDGWYVNDGKDDVAAEYYRANFSDNLIASMDRPDGPFDEQYYTEMYAEAEGQYNDAIANFELAQQFGDKADGLQLVVLIFAIGLALAAYASLLAQENAVRLVFAVGSILALIFGLITYFTL